MKLSKAIDTQAPSLDLSLLSPTHSNSPGPGPNPPSGTSNQGNPFQSSPSYEMAEISLRQSQKGIWRLTVALPFNINAMELESKVGE